MTPSMRQLSGLSVEVASKFGMPHIHCHYRFDDTDSNRLDDGARCAICGRVATNSHHEPPKGLGGGNRQFALQTPMGLFILKPALIALCGSGTTGCHNGFHGGARFSAQWVWERPEYGEMWWQGYWLSHGIAPHDNALYEMGHWEISDVKKKTIITYRGSRSVMFK